MPRRHPSILLVATISTVAGIYFATQVRYAAPYAAEVSWSQALTVNLTYYWAWGALVPIVVHLARRFPLEGGRRFAALLAHIVFGAIVTVTEIAVSASILHALAATPQYSYEEFLTRAFVVNFHSSYPTYWVILFAYLSFDYYAQYQDKALRAVQLEARLFEARLTALRMQLHPHFLFNTLNSISALMYTDVAAADTMMTRLSELLRLTLSSETKAEIDLRQELDLLQRYVGIEKVRFEDRLRISIDVDDQTLDALVPAFVLQPLAENAIRHAIAPRARGGQLAVRARRDRDTLQVTVTDDGPGLPDGTNPREGVGLSNTRSRLSELYGAAHRFELLNRPEGGLCVSLTIPFRVAA